MNIVTPAESIDLMTLADIKLALNVPPTTTNYGPAISMFITNVSDELATMAGWRPQRQGFGKPQVTETFYDISQQQQRLYLTRWPTSMADIVSMTDGYGNNLLASPDWFLEEKTGILYKGPSAATPYWSGQVTVTYSGGYDLPDDAPPALKALCIVMTREAYYEMVRGAILSGIRMISHKSARVMYYPTGVQGVVLGRGVPASAAAQRAIYDVLGHFSRYWV